MTQEPYDQELHEQFDQITNPHRHPGGRIMNQQKQANTRPAEMFGCAALILAVGIVTALIIFAVRW